MSEPAFHFLLPPGVRVDVAEWARVLAPHLGQHAAVLAIQLRQRGGLILPDVPESVASPVEEATRELLGAAPFRVSADEPLEPPVVYRVSAVTGSKPDTEELGFELKTSSGVSESFQEQNLATFFLAVRTAEREPEEVRDELIPSYPWQWSDQREQLFSNEAFRVISADLYLVQREPVDFYMIPVGAIFPDQAREGISSSIDNWLLFGQRLFDKLKQKASPETRRFWEEKDVSGIRFEDRERLECQLTWTYELVARGWWNDE